MTVRGQERAPGHSDAELLDRATRDDYDQWLSTALAAGGCVRPIRLRGTVRDIDTTTGEIIRDLDTEDLPDKAIYVPCGDRRASVCPPCAETYRADTYQLIRAGLAGGKGVPESVAIHPCVFATFTAPSFGPVHTRVTAAAMAGRPLPSPPQGELLPARAAAVLRAAAQRRPTPAWAGHCARTATTTHAAVVWNAHAPELWRRTVIGIRRQLDKLAKTHGTRVRLSYAKVAEFQRRGLIHFHAIFRLDGHRPRPPRTDRATPPGVHR